MHVIVLEGLDLGSCNRRGDGEHGSSPEDDSWYWRKNVSHDDLLNDDHDR